MLNNSIVMDVSRLLTERKLSQRKIAEVVGVSRGTVCAISSGKRPDYPPRVPTEDESWKPTGPRERCPTCGGKVYMPCRACELRKLQASGKIARRCNHRSGGLLQLDLHPKHQQGYEEMHAKREKAELEKRVAEAGDETSDLASMD